MNSNIEKEKNLEDMSGLEIITEIRKMKVKLEQMLQDQNLPAGSAGVEIDDLTAAHSETNVKLERLAKLEKKEHSIKETEEKLDKAREAITKHENELKSVRHSIVKDVKKLDEQDKIIKEAEYEKKSSEDEYYQELHDRKEELENYEKFQESSIDDSFVDEEDAHYTKERVEQGEEDHRALEDADDDGEMYFEAAAQDAATKAEEAASARGATLEEQHDAYQIAYDDFYSANVHLNSFEPYGVKERIDAAQERKDIAMSDISKRQAKITELEDQHEEISSNLNQAYVEHKAALQLVDNMKSERDQLRNDIINNLKPLVGKINMLYENFISAKKSNKVVEKSNKVKNELSQLIKELGHTHDKLDEHKELVRHGNIKNTIFQISEIDHILHNLTIKHAKILETLGEKDDRNTSGLNLEDYVTVSHHMLPEEHEKVRSFFIQRFNIPETKLVTDFEKQRLDLEVDLAIFRRKKQRRTESLKSQEHQAMAQEYKIGSLGRGSLESLIIQKPPPDRLQYMTSSDVEPPAIQPDLVLVEEFSWISTLETEFRKLVEIVFKDINNWWTELVPDNVRYNARKHNDRNEVFLKWDETQDFKLLGKLNFTALTQIFTGVKCWKYFSDVFPKPADYQQDWMISIKTRLIDTGYCRTRVGHTHRLDDMTHEMLKANYGFFIKCMTDFKKRNV